VELIFLDGEEAFARHMSETDGLYGSRHDVMRRGATLPRWQINLDMVGGRNKTIAAPLLDTSDFMFAQYRTAVRALGLSEEKWTVWPGGYLDDHVPYLEAGVDSLNLIAAFSGSNWWHTTRDNMSRICPRSLRDSGQITLQLVRQLLNAASAGGQ
jgi:glutaminyl-peptide cyclotransferase